jgi:hypothetical protein
MMIFHACIPSGWRVSGMTVLSLTRPAGLGPRLEPGQRALGDASDIRDKLAVRAQSLDSWADLVERGRDRGGGFLLPEVHLTLDSQERQR